VEDGLRVEAERSMAQRRHAAMVAAGRHYIRAMTAMKAFSPSGRTRQLALKEQPAVHSELSQEGATATAMVVATTTREAGSNSTPRGGDSSGAGAGGDAVHTTNGIQAMLAA
jgi:hypothetical protein